MWRNLHVLLGAVMLAVSACSSPAVPPTPSAGPPATTVAPKPVSSPSTVASPAALVGGRLPTTDPAIHVFLWGNAGTTACDLTLAKDAGFHWVKQRFEWR